MNVICYKRVSTEEQRLHGYGLGVQEKSMKEWCERNNHEILQMYTEDYSGKDFDRPEWNKLMKYVKANRDKVDMVLCYRWDRLGRNLVESMEVINVLNKMEVKVQASDQEMEMNSDDPDMMFMKVFHLTLPEIENKKISKRTIEGMRGGMMEGCWMGGAPIGYDNFRTPKPDEKSTLIPNKDADLVKEVFNKMASGAYSADEVRRWANGQGLKLVKQSMLNMIRNVAYIGKIKVLAKKKEPEIIVNGLHPPLITEEIFYTANDVLDGRRRNMDFKSDKTDIYPLKGHLLCPVHKTSLTAYASTGRNGKKHHYYLCTKCGSEQRHRVIDVHKSIEEVLSGITFTAQSLNLYKKTLEKLFDREDINRKNDIDKLQKRIEHIGERKSKLQDGYLDGYVTPTDYKEMKEKIEKELRSHQTKLDELNQGVTPFKKYMTKEVPMLENLVAFFKNANGRTKKKILSCIFSEKLVLEKGRVATTPFSEGVQVMYGIINALQGSKKKKEVISDLLSMSAPPPGLEPGTL